MIDLGSAVGYLILDSSGFAKGFSDAYSQIDKFGKDSQSKLKAVGSSIQTVGTTMTKGITLPIVGAGTAMVKFASDSESALKNFQSQVGYTTESMEEYEEVMNNIYKGNFGDSIDDVADSMATVVKLLGDMKPDELQEVTESAIALRDAFEYDVSESIRTVDTLMKNFGLTSREAFDYIVKGQQEGLDFSGEFLDTINEYSVQFRKLGFNAEDMFAILKEGADSGAWNLDKIGDAIKEFSIRVIDGSNTTIEGFELIGLNVEEMSAKFAAGGEVARQAFRDTIEALIDMEDPLQQNIAGVDLFGTMWEDLGPDVIKQIADITNETVDMKGAMDDLKNVKYDTFESAVAGLVRSLQVLGAELGEVLIPKVEKVIEFIQDVTDKFSSLSDEQKDTVVNIGLFVAALGPVLAILGTLMNVFSTVSGGVKGLISLLGAGGAGAGAAGATGAAGGLAGALSGLAAPIAIVIGAVVALFAAWQTNFGGIRDVTAEIVEEVNDLVNALVERYGAQIQAIMDFFFEIASGALKALEELFSGFLNVVKEVINLLSALIEGDWQGVWTSAQNIVSIIFESIMSALGALLDGIVNAIVGIAGKLLATAENTFNNIKSGFENAWNTLMEWFNLVKEDPLKALANLGQAFLDVGRNLIDSFLSGLQSAWESVVSWFEDIGNWISEKISMLWGSYNEAKSAYDSIGGSYASGLDYVPRDMIVKVHEGERILTKQENKSGAYGGNVNVYNYNTFTEPVDAGTADKVSYDIGVKTAREMRRRGMT